MASGLPRFLWEEAMKHVAWLQDQTLASALKGKTPYEMGNKKKPNPGGIQEFGAVAYIKDLTAGKLNARARKGHFIGYDSKSKGYRIYWPDKQSITVEQNVVFNQSDINSSDDLAIIHGKAQSEREKVKTIQNPKDNGKDTERPVNEEPEDPQSQEKASQPHQSPKTTNTIQSPSTSELQSQPEAEVHHMMMNDPLPSSMAVIIETAIHKACIKS